jgi:hypothetical protein
MAKQYLAAVGARYRDSPRAGTSSARGETTAFPPKEQSWPGLSSLRAIGMAWTCRA